MPTLAVVLNRERPRTLVAELAVLKTSWTAAADRQRKARQAVLRPRDDRRADMRGRE